MKKKLLLFVMTGMLAVSSLAGCGSIKDSDIVLTGKSENITAKEANFYARYVQAQYETYYGSYLGDDMWSTEIEEGKTYESNVKKSLLKQMKYMLVMKEHMADYDVELTEDEETAITAAAKEFVEANEEDSAKKVSGDQETVEKVLTLLTIQQKMEVAIEADVDTEVSDDEAAQKSMDYVLFSYTTTDDDGNSTDLTDDEKTQMKEEATAFAEGAKTAEDFSAYATEQGQTSQTATFDSDTTSPDADLIAAADALGEGEVTDVVETDSGCYVAKVTSLLDRDATDSKKESIISDRKEELLEDTCKAWIKEDGVKANKKVWKKISFTDLSVSIKQVDTDTEDTDTSSEDTTSEDTTTETTTDSSQSTETTEDADEEAATETQSSDGTVESTDTTTDASASDDASATEDASYTEDTSYTEEAAEQ